MSVMTIFVSFVSLNHPVVHKFHGPTPIAAYQPKALDLYICRDLHPRRLPVASFAMNPQKEILGKSEGKKDAEKKT
ncbi:uncharacterized protein N7487_012175 [Penicillium crustosum]|uniref:uncharacterized protein n=1 Tax=Penicillium crustosum TaxID=36656 RepID=UPI00238D9AF9|nr:uncharacterized protein N7487_012175 [Penicillium crustosum]KAJ5394534.1 hypothetical protein N7487_012175 [Penicillium crustosum]